MIDPRELVATENLARTEALAAFGRISGRGGSVLVLAGRSPTGAAALAAARHLWNYSVPVRVLLCAPEHRLCELARLQLKILQAMGLRIPEATPADIPAAAAPLGPQGLLLDGTGDPSAEGTEGEFARAARAISGAFSTVQLTPPAGYRCPVPGPSDPIFTPETCARSREEVRLYDSIAIERFGIPGLVLMENAGWRVAREAWAMLGYSPPAEPILVLAGAGNNGGDGLVAARHLKGWGSDVEAVLVGSRTKVLDDAATNLELAEASGVRVLEAPNQEALDAALTERLPRTPLVIDALLGTGLTGKVRGTIARAIELLNASGRRVLAVDIPSGLDANTGEVLGCAVKAERTVTFGFWKPGLRTSSGPELAGEVSLADISLPRELWHTRAGS